jgi:putative toxin-antitoxin system antitoxin component (TIGR02293 family)
LIEGDRLARLARLIVLANTVLEQPDLVREWFRSPQIGLNNQTPLEVLVTEAGAREVEDLLQRIEHGVLT